MKQSRLKLTIAYGLSGAVAGYLALHPASMLIHQLYSSGTADWGFLRVSFSCEHLPMAIYFSALGLTAGLLFGIYPQRIVQLLERLRRLAVTDYLTGINNRRYFFERFSEDLSRAVRYRRELSLLMLDIDNFKNYNDLHGHQQGDALLRELTGLLSQSIRKPDYMARYGGEEFVIVAPESGKEPAHRMAEKLRVLVERHQFDRQESQPGGNLTVSIGVASFPDDGGTVDELIGRADAALYVAKGRGRNLVSTNMERPRG
jgi:diguanylate cyclase (GGDEF)-like protein